MEELQEGEASRSPTTSWPWWIAPLALLVGLVLAAVAGLMVDLPALAFGVDITHSPTPPGLVLADTFVQDLSFVVAAVYCASIGRRAVHSWQFGLRRPGVGWWSAIGRVLLLLVAFVVLSVIWTELFNPGEDKLLNTLGSNEGTALLLLSAALTCVMAPICEEFLFRGLMFTALRNWKGTLPAALITGLVFGGVHAGSAPALDLIPLAGLGFGLCLLYRYTGSLYPSIVAHSINNSIAFSSLENWDWQAPVLLVAALLAIGAVVLACRSVGLISGPTSFARADA
ncbi:MAG TPA: CPBP family intramembrane glutamic endopeptidase [Solirubrobacteraceae bacterium]|nr:CPBP family intramembrane glutamic endopeptidase [Solirubrobacteraceae bacterium]